MVTGVFVKREGGRREGRREREKYKCEDGEERREGGGNTEKREKTETLLERKRSDWERKGGGIEGWRGGGRQGGMRR